MGYRSRTGTPSKRVYYRQPGRGAFYATDLDLLLKLAGIQNIVLTAITTDVCAHSTMREVSDCGYECLLFKDCTAATSYENHQAAIEMLKTEGVFGAVSDSTSFLRAIA